MVETEPRTFWRIITGITTAAWFVDGNFVTFSHGDSGEVLTKQDDFLREGFKLVDFGQSNSVEQAAIASGVNYSSSIPKPRSNGVIYWYNYSKEPKRQPPAPEPTPEPIVEPIPVPIAEPIPQPDPSPNVTMVDQKLNNFTLKNGIVSGSITLEKTPVFNDFFNDKALDSFIQVQFDNTTIGIKQTQISFIDNNTLSYDVSFDIDQSIESVIVESYIWYQSQAMAFNQSIVLTDSTPAPTPIPEPIVEPTPAPEPEPIIIPDGFHLMPDGSIMADSDMPKPTPIIDTPVIDSTINTMMISQSIGSFILKDGIIKGEILYIANTAFNSTYYNEPISSIVQIKSKSGVPLVVKENILNFTQTERDERIQINEGIGNFKEIIIEFYVWKSFNDLRAFSETKVIQVIEDDPTLTCPIGFHKDFSGKCVPDDPKGEIPRDNLIDTLKGFLFGTVALSLLARKY